MNLLVTIGATSIDPQIRNAEIRTMIEVRCRPTVEPAARGGWELVLWAGEPFDYSTPFREMLTGIAGVLNEDAPASIELPAYEEYEDFVEGTFQFGGETIRAYYEHSLGYLAWKIADRLAPLMQIA